MADPNVGDQMMVCEEIQRLESQNVDLQKLAVGLSENAKFYIQLCKHDEEQQQRITALQRQVGKLTVVNKLLKVENEMIIAAVMGKRPKKQNGCDLSNHMSSSNFSTVVERTKTENHPIMLTQKYIVALEAAVYRLEGELKTLHQVISVLSSGDRESNIDDKTQMDKSEE